MHGAGNDYVYVDTTRHLIENPETLAKRWSILGRAGRNSVISMDGGSLTIEWDIATKHVLMTGEAIHVFDEEIEIADNS